MSSTGSVGEVNGWIGMRFVVIVHVELEGPAAPGEPEDPEPGTAESEPGMPGSGTAEPTEPELEELERLAEPKLTVGSGLESTASSSVSSKSSPSKSLNHRRFHP